MIKEKILNNIISTIKPARLSRFDRVTLLNFLETYFRPGLKLIHHARPSLTTPPMPICHSIELAHAMFTQSKQNHDLTV